MAASVDSGMSTPLPPASPLALSTTRKPQVLTYCTASSNWDAAKTRNCAVGIEWRAMNAFEKALEPSIRAASAVGPNTGMPTSDEVRIKYQKRREGDCYLCESAPRRHRRGAARGQGARAKSKCGANG